jgi:hypothetical protein
METKPKLFVYEVTYTGNDCIEVDYEAQLPDGTTTTVIGTTNGGPVWQDTAEEVAKLRFPNHEIVWRI